MTNHTKFLINSYKQCYAGLESLGINPANHDPRITYQTFMDMVEELDRLRTERNAAVSDLEIVSEINPRCETCIHDGLGPEREPCASCMSGYLENHWRWRGVKADGRTD